MQRIVLESGEERKCHLSPPCTEQLPSLSSFIFAARSDADFIRHTLPGLCQLTEKAGVTPVVVVDATKPGGVLGETLSQTELSRLLNELSSLRAEDHHFEVEQFSPDPEEVRKLSRIHFGYPHRETHCFRGYPVHGSIRQFHEKETDYILHMDCDMLFYEEEGFSWIAEGISLMESNEDILCVLPRGGPPASKDQLHQGTTIFHKDKSRDVFLFKNFTSRHYLVHRKRFLDLLPTKPTWLSWREPIKSRLFGNGKMLCWETTVEKALERSTLCRADLMTKKAWSLHPGDRSERFLSLLPSIAKEVTAGKFPGEQAGHFDLHLDSWESHLN